MSLIFLLVFSPSRYEEMDHLYILSLSIVFIILVVNFLRSHRRYTSNWLRFDVMFLIGYGIVHFQIPFLASIGIEPSRPSFIWINKEVINFATWMSLVSIILWMYGYSLNKNKMFFREKTDRRKSFKINYYLYDFLLLFSFVMFLFLVGGEFLSGAYNLELWGEGANYAYLILRILLYLRIIYFMKDIPADSSIKKIFANLASNKLFALILIAYTILFFRTGDRGPVLQIALLIGGAYAIFIKPILLRQLIVFISMGAFIFTILRFGRGRDAIEFEEGNIFARGYSGYQEQRDDINITDELATSVRIQYRALDVVPEKHPYLYGLTFLTVGIGIIPFGASAFLDLFEIPKIYSGSSNFFTFLGQGHYPTYGEGSEILADIYINFGLYGTFLVMFFFGVWSGKIYRQAEAAKFISILIILTLLYSALSMNRGMLFTPLKDIVYILFFNYIFSKINK